MDDTKLAAIVDAVVRELKAAGVVQPASSSAPQPASTSQASAPSSVVPVKPRASTSSGSLSIDLPDPTTPKSAFNSLCRPSQRRRWCARPHGFHIRTHWRGTCRPKI